MEIADVVEAIRADRVRITDHAYEEAEADGLSFDEMMGCPRHSLPARSQTLARRTAKEKIA